MMWLLTLLPDSLMYFVILAIFALGVAGYLLGSFGGVIPVLKPHANIIKIASVVLMLLGIYFYGGYSTEMMWRERVAELQAEIDKKDNLSAIASKDIVIKYINKTKVIKEKGDVIIKEVPKYITEKSDAECTIPQSYIVLHNSASKNEVPDPTRGVDGSASGLKLSTTLETVVGNYVLYHETAEQLKALQEWVKTQEKIYNDH